MRNKNYKRKQKPVSDAVKAYVKKAVTSLPEKKFHDLNQTVSVVGGAPGLIFSISDVNRGTLDTERVGDRLTPYKLRIHATIYRSTTPLLAVDCFARVILFQWHGDSFSDPPTLADFCQGTTSTGANNVNSLFTNDTQIKYTILMNKLINISYTSPNHSIVFDVKKKMRKINYLDGTTDAVNKIYLLIYCDSILLVNLPTISHYTRLIYLDA